VQVETRPASSCCASKRSAATQAHCAPPGGALGQNEAAPIPGGCADCDHCALCRCCPKPGGNPKTTPSPASGHPELTWLPQNGVLAAAAIFVAPQPGRSEGPPPGGSHNDRRARLAIWLN
jgi:hypothetical protein